LPLLVLRKLEHVPRRREFAEYSNPVTRLGDDGEKISGEPFGNFSTAYLHSARYDETIAYERGK